MFINLFNVYKAFYSVIISKKKSEFSKLWRIMYEYLSIYPVKKFSSKNKMTLFIGDYVVSIFFNSWLINYAATLSFNFIG